MARRLSTILLAIAISVAMIVPASAEPVSIISGLVSSFLVSSGIAGAIGLTGAALAAVSTVITSIIIAGAAFLLAPGSGKIDPTKAKDTFEATEASEVRAVGRVRLGGLIAFGSTKSTQRYRLLLHAKKLQGIEQHYFGGFEVIRDQSNGDILSRPYVISGTKYIRIKQDLGDPAKTAWSDLVTDFPALWTSNHRARGIAQTLIRYTSPGLTSSRFLRLYQNGIPNYEMVARGEPVYDPRDSGQDPDDSDTWVWSDNGVLCALHIAASFPGLSFADFDLAQIASEATLADASVNTLTGTEPRSRCWGVWPSENNRGETLSQVLQSVGAEIYTTDNGLHGIRLIDDARDEDLTILEKHILAFDWKSGPEGIERPNVARLRYYSPERRYEMAEIDLTGQSWARDDEEIAKVGERPMDIDLPFCPSASQAQRIARRIFAYARADRGVAKTNMVGMAAWGTKVVDFEMPDLNETFRCAIASPRCSDKDGTVEIPFIILPTLAAWDETTMENPAPVDVPDIVYAGASDKPAAASAACVITYPDATIETRFDIDNPSGGSFVIAVASLEAVYRKYTAGLPDEWIQITPYISNEITTPQAIAYTTTDLTGIPVDFRYRSSNSDDENTEWSDTAQFTPAAINTAPAVPIWAYDSGAGTLTIQAPDTFHVSYLRVVDPIGTITTHKVRPGDVISLTPSSGTWNATARSSNGTASSNVSQLI